MRDLAKYFLAGAAAMLAAEKLAPMVTPATASPMVASAVKYGIAGAGVFAAHKIFHKAV